MICALDRAEASASALKLAAVAELIRRRPDPGCEPVLAGPGGWEEFTASELAWALADTRRAADTMLDLAATLAVKLPGTFTASGDDGPPGGYGTWRLSTGLPGRPDLLIALDPIATGTCDHRFEARGHDPGAKLRHLTQIRHATCTGPTCRRPSAQSDFEHNIPYEAGGRTCECNGGPKCRHEHRIKQHPRWNVEQITPGTFRWTVPSGRQYTTEPTRYPI